MNWLNANAAPVLRRQLRKIRVDRHELDADAEAGDEAAKIEAERGGLAGHGQRRDRVPQQREGEDGAPAVAVGHPTEPQRAEEHAGEGEGDQGGVAVDVEEVVRRRREDAGLEQARRDIGGERVVVHLEERAHRQQDHEAAHSARRRQTIDPCRDRRGLVAGHAETLPVRGRGWYWPDPAFLDRDRLAQVGLADQEPARPHSGK